MKVQQAIQHSTNFFVGSVLGLVGFFFFSLVVACLCSSHPSRSAALRSDEAESSPHPVRAFLLFLAPLHFSSSAAAATAAQLVSVPRVSPTSSPQPMAQAALGISAQGNHIPL